MEAPRRVLFIKPSSLGDIVHAIPAFRTLRAHFPHSHLTWVVKRQWAPILRRVEGIDEIRSIGANPSDWIKEAFRLRRSRFDLAIDLQGLFRSGALAWLSGAPTRVGFESGREGSPWFYTQRVPIPAQEVHAVDRYQAVIESLGASPMITEPCLPIADEDGRFAADLLQRHGICHNTPWIALNVSARWGTKRWPLEYFATAADQLQHSGIGRIVLIGGQEDLRLGGQLQKHMRTRLVNLVGATPIGVLPAILSKARILITNDSGPMHVAAAVGTRVVAMFGPTSHRRTGPYGSGHQVLSSSLPCSPCYSRTCRQTVQMECLQNLPPRLVVEAAWKLLEADSLKAPEG